MDRTLSATCTCGETVTVERPRRGQSLYGTLAGQMARHEQHCRSNRGSGWSFDHPGESVDVELTSPIDEIFG